MTVSRTRLRRGRSQRIVPIVLLLGAVLLCAGVLLPRMNRQLPGGVHLPPSIQNAGQSYSLEEKVGGVKRFEVRPQDHWWKDVGSPDHKERSEMAFRDYFLNGQAFWLRFSQKLDPTQADQAGWSIIGQIHTTPPPGTRPSPPVRQVYDQTGFSIVVQWQSPGEPSKQKIVFSDPGYETRRWYSYVYHARFGQDQNAFLKVWRVGVQIVDYTGPIGYPVERGIYFKIGIYRPQNPFKMVVWYRDVVPPQAESVLAARAP